MINKIQPLLQSRKVEERLQAVNILSKRSKEEAVPLLLPLLRDPSSYLLVKVVRLLCEMAETTILADFFALYDWIEENPSKRDPNCEIRGEIIALIGKNRALNAVDCLYRALHTVQIEAQTDVSIQLRANAALLLADFHLQGLLADLSIMLFDFEPNVPVQTTNEYRYAKMLTRQAAAKGIGIYGDPSGAAVLAVKLKYPDQEVPEVLVECMDALVALEDPRAKDWIMPYLEHEDPYLVATAATVLSVQLKEEAISILVEALRHPMPEAQTALVYTISSIRSKKTTIILRQLCTHPSTAVRKIAGQLV